MREKDGRMEGYSFFVQRKGGREGGREEGEVVMPEEIDRWGIYTVSADLYLFASSLGGSLNLPTYISLGLKRGF